MAAVTDAIVSPGCPTVGAPPLDRSMPVDPAPFVRSADGGSELDLLVRGARCAGCIRRIEGGLAATPGVASARLNLSTGKLAVRFNAGRLAPATIVSRLADLGYPATPFDPAKAEADVDAEGRRLLRRLAVAGFAAANVMLLSVSVWSGHDGEMAGATRTLFHWISALIATPAALYAGQPFFESAWSALRRGRANMDVPISLGVLLALSLSLYETSRSGEHAYFDAAVGLLFFLLIGRWLDHRLRARARAAARELLAMQAATASRIEPDGRVVAVAAADVRPGDRLVLAAGDRVPVDVRVEQGVSEADVSLATGESAPVRVAVGDLLRSGVVNLSQRLIVRAEAASQDSFLAELARLIEAGEQVKNRYVRLADRAAKVYVPLVHSAAALTFLGWLAAGAGVRDGLTAAISLLIITCPCALGLAVPAVQVVATGRLFRMGVLVKSGDALERLAGVDHVVFDKTGTLTRAAFTVQEADRIDPAALESAARLARGSRHPLSRAIAELAGKGPAAEQLIETPGEGLEGLIDGVCARLGRAAWAGVEEADSSASPGPVVWFAMQGRAPARFAFVDAPRSDAASTVRALEGLGVSVEMMTGDAEAPAEAVARAVGVADWRARVSPAGKVARLEALAAEGRRVLMVGDGLNDAPALARAHVSISPGAAAEASQHASDFVLQGEGLSAIADAIVVARRARGRVLENFGFAVLYNALASPVAMAGLVTPMIAAIAMSSSSLIVTLNALRLARRGRA
jgi:Cu2+-exporting ATPase